MGEWVIRFFIGGIVVSLFSLLGDILRPKSVICVSWVMARYKPATLVATTSLMPVWFVTSFGLWYLFARSS